MKRYAILALSVLALPAAAGVPAKPEKAAVCAACHGETGVSAQPAMFPNLAGQHANYLENALKEYRTGTRKNAIMSAQATGLSDADIEQLAAYFAAQNGPLYTPSIPHPEKK